MHNNDWQKDYPKNCYDYNYKYSLKGNLTHFISPL